MGKVEVHKTVAQVEFMTKEARCGWSKFVYAFASKKDELVSKSGWWFRKQDFFLYFY